MFANLIAYNSKSIGKISEASVEYNALNPDDVIELTIGLKKYCFDSNGKLVSSTEIQTCYLLNNHMGCAPTYSKTED
jgi:hypothetical protein